MNLNVSLPDELTDFIESEVATGRFGSSSEVVSEALRLMGSGSRKTMRPSWRSCVRPIKTASTAATPESWTFAALKAEARGMLAALKA